MLNPIEKLKSSILHLNRDCNHWDDFVHMTHINCKISKLLSSLQIVIKGASIHKNSIPYQSPRSMKKMMLFLTVAYQNHLWFW